MLLLDAFHSATIEGARTTVEQVRRAFDQPVTKDDQMVVNTVRGLRFAFADTSPYPVWLTAAILHFYFVYIHPFCDGNGRMARILMQSWLFHHGKTKVTCLPFSRSINRQLSCYYTSLRAAEQIQENGKRRIDITPFLDYLLSVMEASMVTFYKLR